MTGARVTHPERLQHDVANRDRSSECWLDGPWRHDHDGYGRIWTSGLNGAPRRNVKAHVLAKEIATGGHPDGMQGLHTCDTPRCYNPDHITWGTVAENMGDMARKGRAARGERNGQAKVTAEQVAEIRDRYKTRSEGAKSGDLQRLADAYGISRSMVLLIVQREQWAHVA